MTIRLRIAILTAAILAAAVGLNSWLIVKRMRNEARTIVQMHIVGEASHVAALARPHLKARDPVQLARVSRQALIPADIRRVLIVDRDGRVLGGSPGGPPPAIAEAARRTAATGKPVVGPLGDTTTGMVPVLDNDGSTLGTVVMVARTAGIRRSLQTVRTAAIATGTAATVAGVALAYLLAAYLTMPLSTLLTAIRRVASGDFESRVAHPPTPELQEIGQAFNEMAFAVTQRVRNLEMLNLMAAEVSMSRRLSEVARAVANTCATVLDADARIWVFDAVGEKLHSVSVRSGPRRVVAGVGCPVTRAAREARPVVIGENDADLPPGSRVATPLAPVDAAVIVPLTAPDGVVGALSADAGSRRRSMSREQISLAIAIGNIVGPAVAAQLRAESQARSARMLQRILVPQMPPVIPGLDIATVYQPAEETSQLGGDYFDFIRLSEDSWGFVVGDVSGKGLPAAQYTAMAKYVLRSYLLEYRSLAQALALTNAALLAQMRPEAFITLFCLVIDLTTRKLRYARAGHPLPILYRQKTGATVELFSQGSAAGIFDDAAFDEAEEKLAPGDSLVIFTDGLTEARRNDEMYGEERLAASLTASAHLPARDIAAAISEDAKSFSADGLKDDVVVLVLKAE